LKDKFSATGRFRLQKRIEADITTCWNSRTGNYTNTESVMTGYDPYWKTDAAISFDISGKSGITTLLYVKADNIFDSEYCDFGGLMMPGIWVTAGASITIK
jgi:iron complex outermembrane receptor protein